MLSAGAVVEFKANGTIAVAFSPESLDQPLDSGTYTFADSLLIWISSSKSAICPSQTGKYDVTQVDETHIQLKVREDLCEPRKGALEKPIAKVPVAFMPGKATGPKDVWVDATDVTIGTTAEWTNKVELADLNGDGRVDLLFANGGDYETAGTPIQSRIFFNQGAGKPFKEGTAQVFGDTKMLARVIKVRDVNGDTYPDMVVGAPFQMQSHLYLSDGKGNFKDMTKSYLPQMKASVGDIEFGDVDSDGDLDMVLANWGDGSPMQNSGGRTLLWLNDGKGQFTDATSTNMPNTLVKFSWELELVDVDNDYDLDLLVSCKRCSGSFLFRNDGKGQFTDATKGNLPQFSNNYDFEAMDVNGDGYLDLTTINDGPDGAEHLFINNKQGGYIDATASLWPPTENPGFDDNMVAFLDYDSDGDADFVIGALSGPDRLQINDGKGHFKAAPGVFSSGPATFGTLGIAIADLNGDNRLDVVQAQGENPDALSERIYLGKNIKPDSAKPIISLIERPANLKANKAIVIRARVHDNKSPTMPHDWQSVMLRWNANGSTQTVPMQWYGEYLWRATVEKAPSGQASYQVCATDVAANQACSSAVFIEVK